MGDGHVERSAVSVGREPDGIMQPHVAPSAGNRTEATMKRTLILTTPMMTGDDVVFAQRLLKRHGDYDGELDGEFGILSSQACKDAQSRLGYARPKRAFATPLEKFLSGKAEPTAAMKKRGIQWEKQEANGKHLRRKALAEMKKLIGTVEDPPHSNHTTVGAFYGFQGEWCAMAVTTAYVKAGSTGFARASRWSYVPDIVSAARTGQYGLSVTVDPRPGDLVCYDLDGSNFATSNNHVGMYLERTGPTTFRTIEGNVDDTCKQMDRSMTTAPRIVFVRPSR